MVKLIGAVATACMLVPLAACGGDSSSSSNDVEAARQRTAAKRAETINLAAASPCNADNQCAVLTFDFPDPGCNLPDQTSFHAYSLVAPNAQEAQLAADQQKQLAAETRAMQKPYDKPCPTIAVLPPIAVCEANTCVLRNHPY